MTGQIYRAESKPTLGMRRTQVPGTGIKVIRVGLITPVQLSQTVVVRNEERFHRGTLEPLLTVPGHVLDGGEGAVQEEEVIEPAVADDGVVSAFDDAG